MPVEFLTPPPSQSEALRQRALALTAIAGGHLLGARGARADVDKTFRVFSLPYDAVAARSVEAAVFVAWQQLLVSDEEVVGSAEIQAGDDHAVTVSHDPYGSEMAAAVRLLEAQPGLEGEKLELRLLRINALHISAAWLAGARHLIVALAPAPQPLVTQHAYREPDFFEALIQGDLRPFGLSA